MPFDAEVPAASVGLHVPTDLLIELACDPASELAHSDPQALIAYLFLSPRPCAALDALLGL